METFQNELKVINATFTKKQNLLKQQRCPWSCATTFIVLGFKIPLIWTIYGHLAVNLILFN